MFKLHKKFDSKKRRLAKRGPSSFAFKNKSNKSWRSKEYILFRLPRNKVLATTARTFRTQKRNRSKKYRQLVIGFQNLPIRELSFRIRKLTKNELKRRTKSHNKRPTKTYTVTIHIRPYRMASLVIISLGLIGVIIFGLDVSKAPSIEVTQNYSIPTPPPNTDYAKPITLPRSAPVQLQIPSIGVTSDAISVGRLADGSMETPPALDPVVGWYKYSPTPGELGPSVIAGHVDNYNGPSVFWNLNKLQPGATINIERADGSTATFVVDSVQQFDQAAFPTQAVYGNLNYAGLRLITCGGAFNKLTGHYTHNTVVFASLKI